MQHRVIENLEQIQEKGWKTEHPDDKNRYASKCTTKITCEGADNILKQELIVTDCELQAELEDNYNNKLRQKLTEKATYRKNGSTSYHLFFGQLHSNIVTAAKKSTVPLFETMNKERDVVGLLSILLIVCVKNLSESKVDPHLDALQIISSTLSYTQK
mmetsp:Transcript_1852/g.2120  ORF Transcript_1852/g.2120 Transcript_1852/m.2120 type:complete len:158 (-) Transcript_1852:301-774(-)